jgi:hypothetical protein
VNVQAVPYGARNLYIRCSDDRQFRGITTLMRELSKRPGSYLMDQPRGHTDLSRRRVLRRVLVSGHGSPTEAGFELGSADELRPADLRLPGDAGLYLMGCYQSRQKQRLAWSAGSGVRPDRIRGCSGETESALSTCLLLHLLEDGPESIERWFPVWRHCNEAFRPHFPLIREVYARKGADPLAALARLRGQEELAPLFGMFEEFLAVIDRSPAYLEDLV